MWTVGLSVRAVRFARVSAIASLVLGAAGQIAYHLMTAARVTAAPWWIVTVVACLPVAVLGMGAALAHLVRHPAPDTAPDGAPDTAADTPDADAGMDVRPDGPTSDRTPVRAPTVRKPGGGAPGKASGKSRTTAEEVARLRRRDPGMTASQIARRLGVTDRTVRRHLADLADLAGPTGAAGAERMSAVPARVMEVAG